MIGKRRRSKIRSKGVKEKEEEERSNEDGLAVSKE